MGMPRSYLEKLKKYVSNTCFNPKMVNPPIVPKFDEIEIATDATKKVLVITVDATNNAHTYKADNDVRSRYFVRTDSNTRAATNGLERELLRRKNQLEPWDKRNYRFDEFPLIGNVFFPFYNIAFAGSEFDNINFMPIFKRQR